MKRSNEQCDNPTKTQLDRPRCQNNLRIKRHVEYLVTKWNLKNQLCQHPYLRIKRRVSTSCIHVELGPVFIFEFMLYNRLFQENVDKKASKTKSA